MAHQINPSLARLWLPSGSRQYGYVNPVRLSLQEESEQRAVDYLEQGVSESQYPAIGKLAKIPEPELGTLLTRLSGVLRTTSGFTQDLTEAEIAGHFAEISRIYLTSDTDPAEIISRRRASRIFIESMGRTGLTICRGLTSAFLGSILTLDNSLVKQSDVGNLGYTKGMLGISRAKAANEILMATGVQQHSRISGSMQNLDLAILIANDAVSPQSYQIWMRREVPHISIVFDEGGVQLSPIIIPGITRCLACMELAKMDENPDWVAIAPQLLALDRSLEDSAVVLFAASLAVNQALTLIDSGAANLLPTAYRLERSGQVSRFEVKSRECGCRIVRS